MQQLVKFPLIATLVHLCVLLTGLLALACVRLRKRHFIWLFALLLSAAGGLSASSKDTDLAAPALVAIAASPPADPAAVQPLAVGDSLPEVTVQTVDGEPVQLPELVSGSKAVVVFYRGGWCPYCNTHLAALGQMEDELTEAGYSIFALSPDSVEHVAQTAQESDFSYVLLSDSSGAAARAFGLAFTVDDATNERLKGYGIDLQEASGEDHRQLPVPAVFLVDEEGTIVFRHHDPDYTQRLSADVLRSVIADR